jgi:hypothetical protein
MAGAGGSADPVGSLCQDTVAEMLKVGENFVVLLLWEEE